MRYLSILNNQGPFHQHQMLVGMAKWQWKEQGNATARKTKLSWLETPLLVKGSSRAHVLYTTWSLESYKTWNIQLSKTCKTETSTGLYRRHYYNIYIHCKLSKSQVGVYYENIYRCDIHCQIKFLALRLFEQRQKRLQERNVHIQLIYITTKRYRIINHDRHKNSLYEHKP